MISFDELYVTGIFGNCAFSCEMNGDDINQLTETVCVVTTIYLQCMANCKSMVATAAN